MSPEGLLKCIHALSASDEEEVLVIFKSQVTVLSIPSTVGESEETDKAEGENLILSGFAVIQSEVPPPR